MPRVSETPAFCLLRYDRAGGVWHRFDGEDLAGIDPKELAVLPTAGGDPMTAGEWWQVKQNRDEALRQVETLRELRRMDAEVLAERDRAIQERDEYFEHTRILNAALLKSHEERDAARNREAEWASKMEEARALASRLYNEPGIVFKEWAELPEKFPWLTTPSG